MLRRHADGDRAADLAIGQLLTVHRGDETALNVINKACDGGNRRVERLDLELDVARADNDLPRGRGGGWRLRAARLLRRLRTNLERIVVDHLPSLRRWNRCLLLCARIRRCL